jgi:hypothetical protein
MSDRGRHSGHATARSWRPSTIAVVGALACVALGIGTLAYAANDDSAGPTAPSAGGRSGHDKAVGLHQREAAPNPIGPLMRRSTPRHLDIPSVGIHTGLLRLGLNADGTLQVPWKPLLAGWYRHSPTPGELGPAIIAGHVDSWATGPAVFYHLGQVVVGARVLVTRADTTVAPFAVTAVTSYPKATFPTDLVYGDVDRAELRLITCGNWNGTTHEYDDDVVVFARLVRTPA